MSRNKKFEWGMFCGRMHPIHSGHEHVIDTGFCVCENMLILLGSAQESGTKRNPYSYEVRARLIEKIYSEEVKSGKLIIKPINDLSNDPENNITTVWGQYVLDHAMKYIGRLPDLMIYGNDDARSRWFDKDAIKYINELIVSRYYNTISATQIRKYLLENDIENLKKNLNPAIHDEIPVITEILKKII